MDEPVEVMRGIFLNQPTIVTQVGNRVWGEAVPEDALKTEPEKSILIRTTSATPNEEQVVADCIFSVNCFAKTQQEAINLRRVVLAAVHDKDDLLDASGRRSLFTGLSRLGFTGQEETTQWPISEMDLLAIIALV